MLLLKKSNDVVFMDGIEALDDNCAYGIWFTAPDFTSADYYLLDAQAPTPFVPGAWQRKGDEWVAFDQAAIDAAIEAAKPPVVPVETARADAMRAIDNFHAQTVQQLVGSPTQVEKDTWAMKLDAASALVAGKVPSAAGQAFLSAAGLVTDAAKTAWSRAVLERSAGYAAVVGVAERLRSGARDAVRQAPDADGVRRALDSAVAESKKVIDSLLGRAS